MMRFHAALGVLAVLVALVAITFTWQPGLASLYDDSVSYLIMAQVFSPFDPASGAVASAFPNERYPPFFPLVLALSGGSHDWRIAHVVVAASFAASVYLLGWHAWRITRSGAIGVAAALVFALMPGSWLNVKGILSELPYMALVFATLVAYDRLRVSAATAGSGALLGALLAAVLLTRTIGVALVAAVAIAETLQIVAHRDRHRLKASAWMIGIPVAAAALWYGLRPSGGEDTYVSNSVSMATGVARYGVAWFFTWVHANASALGDAWFNTLLIYWDEPWKPGFLIACFLGVTGLLATLWRAGRGEVDGLYCVIFILILLSWPFPGQMYRLAFPVVPLVMVNAFWAAQRALSHYRDPKATQRWAAWGAVLPLTLCIPPVLFFIVERARAPEGLADGFRQTDIAEFYRIPDRANAERSAFLQNGVFGDMVRLRDSTPSGARIMSYMPNYVALLAQRPGVPLERPANGGEMVAQVRKLEPDYIYLANVHPRDSATRLGNPLDAFRLAQPFTRMVWYRGNAQGNVDAVLLAVDKKNLASQ
jgi:hypothetical protein